MYLNYLDDPKLSSQTEDILKTGSDGEEDDTEEVEIDPAVRLELIRKKLNRSHKEKIRPYMDELSKGDEDKDLEQEIDDGEEKEIDPAIQLENIRMKLKKEHKKRKDAAAATTLAEPQETYDSYLEETRREKKKKK